MNERYQRYILEVFCGLITGIATGYDFSDGRASCSSIFLIPAASGVFGMYAKMKTYQDINPWSVQDREQRATEAGLQELFLTSGTSIVGMLGTLALVR